MEREFSIQYCSDLQGLNQVSTLLLPHPAPVSGTFVLTIVALPALCQSGGMQMSDSSGERIHTPSRSNLTSSLRTSGWDKNLAPQPPCGHPVPRRPTPRSARVRPYSLPQNWLAPDSRFRGIRDIPASPRQQLALRTPVASGNDPASHPTQRLGPRPPGTLSPPPAVVAAAARTSPAELRLRPVAPADPADEHYCPLDLGLPASSQLLSARVLDVGGRPCPDVTVKWKTNAPPSIAELVNPATGKAYSPSVQMTTRRDGQSRVELRCRASDSASVTVTASVGRLVTAFTVNFIPDIFPTGSVTISSAGGPPDLVTLPYPEFAGLSGRFVHGEVRALVARGTDLGQGPGRGEEVALYVVEVYEDFTPHPSTPPVPRFARVRWSPRYQRLPKVGEHMLVGLHQYFLTTKERDRVLTRASGQWTLMPCLPHSPLRIVEGTTRPWERDLVPKDYASPLSGENRGAPTLLFQNWRISWLGQPWMGLRQILRWGRRLVQGGQFGRTRKFLPDSLAAGVRSFPTGRLP